MDSWDVKDNRMTVSEQSVQKTHHIERKVSGKEIRKLQDSNGRSIGSGTQTRTKKWKRDPDKDQVSDGDQSSLIYSDDYENTSQSDRSFSPPSPSPSPSPYIRAKTQKGSSGTKRPTGVRKGAPRHPGPKTISSQQRSSGLRSLSLSKDSPPKDLDQVTKRLLSARMLKINELKNALAELQLRTDELQRENRLLKQLQVRHEKALSSSTESEISRLISSHNNETHALRERLRRSQEKERLAESRCTETDMQLRRCRDRLHKLQKLADDQQLGERAELARKLSHAQVKLQDSESRVKDLEKNIELSTGNFHRQLANERKKTHEAVEETQTLREEIDKLNTKLKERERELDTRNIYANRMLRKASKKDLEDPNRRKGDSRSSSKAVQTEELSLDIPSPPLAITNGAVISFNDQTEGYLPPKVLHQEQPSSERRQTQAEEQGSRVQETAREREKESTRGMEIEEQADIFVERVSETDREIEKAQKERLHFKLDQNVENETRQTAGWDQEEDDRKRQSEWQTAKEKGKDKEPRLSEQDVQAIQDRAEEERRRKDLLLAKMREIDMQAVAQDSGFFHGEAESVHTSQNKSTSIFSFTEPHVDLSVPASTKRGRALRPQTTNQDPDLSFGSYAPSFGKPNPRAGFGYRSTSQSVEQSSGDRNEELSGFAKEKKFSLMEQLFGDAALTPCESPSTIDLLSSLSTKSSTNAHRKDEDTPSRVKRTTPNVSESGLAVRAITNLSGDIEELTL